MMKDLSRACHICGSNRGEVLHTQRFVLPQGHPLSEGYDVVACECCGFVFADTKVTQQDYDRFYAQHSKYEDNKTSTGGGESPLDAERLQQTAKALSRFVTNKETRILDIGCANGGLLKALQDLGYTNLCGLDPAPRCVEFVRQVYGVAAQVGSLFSCPPGLVSGGGFECVILSHVLEHVSELNLAVQRIGDLTRPGSVLYVEVPDASRYVEMTVAPFQDFNTEHINHFSLTCLSNLFVRAGWCRIGEGEKTFLSAPGMPYPAIYMVFSKTGTPSRGLAERDTRLRSCIQAYISHSRAIMARIESRLQEVLQDNPEVIVWGTGQLAMKLLAETSLRTAKVVAFVDGNPVNHGKVLRGQPILSPEQIQGLPQPIIVATLLHGAAIAAKIRHDLGLPNHVVRLDSN